MRLKLFSDEEIFFMSMHTSFIVMFITESRCDSDYFVIFAKIILFVICESLLAVDELDAKIIDINNILRSQFLDASVHLTFVLSRICSIMIIAMFAMMT